MVEPARVEVGSCFGVEHVQQIQVERRGKPVAIIVGRVENGGVLDPVGAQQQPVLRIHRTTQIGEEGDRAAVLESAGG